MPISNLHAVRSAMECSMPILQNINCLAYVCDTLLEIIASTKAGFAVPSLTDLVGWQKLSLAQSQ